MILHQLPCDRIEGNFPCREVYEISMRAARDGDHIVELGSMNGKSSAFMGMAIRLSGKKVTFDCIDWHWKDDDLRVFLSNLRMVGVLQYANPIQMDLHEAASLYLDHTLTTIFLPNIRNSQRVVGILESWYPKLRGGGIIAGCHEEELWGDIRSYFGGDVLRRGQSWVVVKK